MKSGKEFFPGSIVRIFLKFKFYKRLDFERVFNRPNGDLSYRPWDGKHFYTRVFNVYRLKKCPSMQTFTQKGNLMYVWSLQFVFEIVIM